MNKGAARSLFSIDNKSIQIEDVHATISKNMDILLRNLGSFSATTHNIESLKKFEKQGKSSNEPEIQNDENDLMVDLTEPANGVNDLDLFDIDIPVSNPPVTNEVETQNNDDLFGLDITPTITTDPLNVPNPVPV